MIFKTKKSAGFWVGLVFGVVIFGFCLWGIGYSLGEEDQVLKVLLYVPAYLFLGIFILLLIGAANHNYRLEDQGFIINWGFRKIFVPWQDVNQIIKVEGRSNFFSVLGFSWPGYIVGLYSVKGIGTVRMYGTRHEDGFIYLKTNRGFFGLTPEDNSMITTIAEKAEKSIETININELSEEEAGTSPKEDNFYNLLLKLNIFFLALFALYLAIFYPGSGAPRFTILLLVLAIGLFFFNIGNASRLYQFSSMGGYFLLVLSIAVTGTFLILSLSEISL